MSNNIGWGNGTNSRGWGESANDIGFGSFKSYSGETNIRTNPPAVVRKQNAIQKIITKLFG